MTNFQFGITEYHTNLIFGTQPIFVPDFYVSPTGSSSNNGSINSPWSLTYAFAGAGGAITPGKKVALRGGTYYGIFDSVISGSAVSPVIVRAYSGERPIISRSGTAFANTVRIDGYYTWYQGFEVTNGMPTSTDPSAQDRTGIDVFAPGTKLINLISYGHTGNGIGAWIQAPDAEVYGCIIFNNGSHGSEDSPPSFGHALYSQNQTGTKLFQDNIMFNQFGAGFHVYGSDTSFLNNYTLLGNVASTNGVGSHLPNYLLGGHIGMQNTSVQKNMAYQEQALDRASWWMGWTIDENGSLDCRDNYVVGSSLLYDWDSLIYRNNKHFFSYGHAFRVSGASVPSFPTYDYDFNSYIFTHDNDSFGGPISVSKSNGAFVNYSTLAAWQAATGVDTNSTFSQTADGKPTSGIDIFIRPNVYEVGRANIIVYNWDHASTITIPGNQFSMLSIGDNYRIWNIQDDPTMQGAGVASGVFNGSSIVLSMSGGTGPAFVVDDGWVARNGHAVPTPATTGPEFNVFVLRKV